MMDHDDAYLLAVADGLLFALGGEWQQLTAYDSDVRRDHVRAAVSALGELGARVSFGDGELAVIPAAGAAHVAILREQLRRIAEIAPVVLARREDTLARLLCTDPFPRIYTLAALDRMPSTPVHVMQASDLAHVPDQWARIREIERFTDLRALVMFGAPLRGKPLPLDVGAFPALAYLDVSRSGIAPDALADLRARLPAGCVLDA